MLDVQKLLTDIGCMQLRLSMRLQNEIPEELVRKFDLTIGGKGNGLLTGPSEGNDEALEGAMDLLFSMLDFLGTSATGTWMEDTFEDEEACALIAKDMLDLAEHLEGYVLEYGAGDSSRKFEGLDREKIKVYAENSNWLSTAAGKIQKDEVRKNRYNLTNDRYLIPLSFDRSIVPDIPEFCGAGPVAVIGYVKRNSEGHMVSIEKVSRCYTLPSLNFRRIVSRHGDRDLLNPLVAATAYDQENDVWSLSNDDAGIYVSKPSWDECVIAFHEYAMFLFETYVDSDREFTGEEAEIREYLRSLLPVSEL